MLKKFILSFLVLSALVVSGFAQEAQWDSTKMKTLWERAKIEVKTDEDYEYLQQMGIDCPQRGECEIIINRWQEKQLEKRGIKVERLQRLRLDEGPNQVEYKLVREIDLKAKGVENIVFGPKKDKNSALSEIILGLKDEEVCVYDSNFNLMWKMHLDDPTFSKNLRYIGGIEYVKSSIYHVDTLLSGEVEIVEEKRINYKFKLFDYTGEKLWELEERRFYELDPSYSISNKGTVIERHHGTGDVTFYDQNGNEIKKIRVCRCEGGIGGSGIGGGVFSDDGEYVLITLNEGEHPDPPEQGVRVLLFTWDGQELWRFHTEENRAGWAKDVSKFGNYVIVSSRVVPGYPYYKRSTYLLSKEGELIKRYEDFFANRICISSNEKYAFLSYYNALFLNLESGKTVSQWWSSRKARLHQIASLDIAEDTKMCGLISRYAVLSRPRPEIEEEQKNIQVLLVGFDGRKVWSETFPFEGGPLFLRLSDDGSEMIVQIGSKIMIYQQVE